MSLFLKAILIVFLPFLTLTRRLLFYDINVSLSADKNYIYPTFVAVTSLLDNANALTRYNVYLLFDEDVTPYQYEMFYHLGEIYPKHRIHMINMGKMYKDLPTTSELTTPTYYRINLPNILQDLNKLIYLDGDVLVLKDLTDMFSIGMKNNYYMGFLDDTVNGVDHLGVKSQHYINAGVLLIDLNKLRQENMPEKMVTFAREDPEALAGLFDQTMINYLCINNIGILPPRFGMFAFEDKELEIVYNAHRTKYDKTEFWTAAKDASIFHFQRSPKPWDINKNRIHKELWWHFAKKTKYYGEIEEYYRKKGEKN